MALVAWPARVLAGSGACRRLLHRTGGAVAATLLLGAAGAGPLSARLRRCSYALRAMSSAMLLAGCCADEACWRADDCCCRAVGGFVAYWGAG